jgi:hypothetical protein
MTVERMRENLAKYYPALHWKMKVAKMPENQIIAIYTKFKLDGKKPIKNKTKKDNQIVMEGF